MPIFLYATSVSRSEHVSNIPLHEELLASFRVLKQEKINQTEVNLSHLTEILFSCEFLKI